eukprot:scaffold14313_cov72-Cylindrotheca_fusiformis.AAC.2
MLKPCRCPMQKLPRVLDAGPAASAIINESDNGTRDALSLRIPLIDPGKTRVKRFLARKVKNN